MTRVQVKICGLRTPEALRASVEGGARFVGLVFYPPSPRAIDLDLARLLARQVPSGVRAVGLFVDPSDDEIERVTSQVALDMVQLHGSETPDRVQHLRVTYGLPVIKALRVRSRDDLRPVASFGQVADWLLFDARPPEGVAALPGGNALSFDWSILEGVVMPKPWMLAGGLRAENVADAVQASGAEVLDVSSGVESRPGHKDPDLIRRFLSTVAGLR